MTSPTTDKAARLYNRLTQRYNVPHSKVHDLAVSAGEDHIDLWVKLANGTSFWHDLDPTRGVLDLSRQAQALINQHIETKG
jgi:hypothetical protein